jgi:hypothetical protein
MIAFFHIAEFLSTFEGAASVGSAKGGDIPDRDHVGRAAQSARRMQHRGEGFRIGHEPPACGGERPFRRDRGSCGIQDLILESCLLPQRTWPDAVSARRSLATGGRLT